MWGASAQLLPGLSVLSAWRDTVKRVNASDDSRGGQTSAQPIPTDPVELAARIRTGDRRSLARAISLVENRSPAGRAVVSELYPTTGDTRIVGMTGPPGVGKSSLVGALVRHLRTDTTNDPTIGVVSVDPSSPFTQGALLGDRIRLADHFLDRKVFIRSMGTRGHLGGLAETSLQVALLLDAWGSTDVFMETVGVGQSEVEVANIADTVVLILMPGSGDAVQALKAGIMEIPDIIVINKADHPDARTLHNQVRGVLSLDAHRDWKPPIVETVATTGEGVDKLWDKIAEHRDFMALDGRFEARRRANLEGEVFSHASARARVVLEERVNSDPRLRELLDAMHRRELDPLTATLRLYEDVFRT
ncbi:MAG: methylmalonyl Co-A mutase-associated GTPase MeaB [Thermoleophilia bacterium]|nr:methylmalonyl Co-A mutase-associated GTPase MeaB [Thermoleophilia bacterium]